MATGFSVFVNIGGKVSPSLANAVNAAKNQVQGLGSSLAGIGARINAPFVAINKHIDSTMKRFSDVQRRGRDLSLAVTAPTGLLARNGYNTVLGFEKELNKAQAYGELSDKERERVEDNAREMARLGLSSAREAVELQRRYIQAGRSVSQAIGMTKPTLNFSLYGDVEPAKAADVITSVAAAYRRPMETLEQAQQVATRIGDVLAKGANISRADVSDFAEGFKYAAPLASIAGMSIEQLAAAIATMNQNGLKGNEAGVAIRSMLVRMVKPTAAAQAALAQYGLSFEQFVKKWSNFNATELRGVLALKGINAPQKLVDSIQSAVKDMDPQTQAKEIREKITGMLVKGMNLKPRDGKIVAKMVTSFLGNMAEQVDANALIEALEAKGVSLGAIANLFDVRQGARLSTLFNGSMYQDFLKAINDNGTNGASERGAQTMLKGFYGAHLRFKFAWDNLWISIARSGVLDVVTSMLLKMANTLNDIAKSSPAALRIGAGLAAAAAAAGPLLFVLGALGRVAAFALKGLSAGLMLLLAPIGMAARGIVGLTAALSVGLVAGLARLRAMAVGLALLGSVGGSGAVLGALGASLLAFGKSLLLFPLTVLRGIGSALMMIVANPVGAVITALVAALAALGVWAYNNWDGIKSFFAGFGQGFMEGLGPAAGVVTTISDGLSSVYNWLSQLLGPLSSSNEQWNSWGQTVGGVVASGINAVISGIQSLIGFFSTAIGKAVALGNAIRGMWGGGGAAAAPAAPAAPLAGARALGGPVSYGKPYLVGERGPELFVPGASGRIETNDTLRRLTADGASAVAASSSSYSGSQSNSATISIQVAGNGDPDQIAREAEAAVYRAFARLESEQRGLLSD
ncbi:phage tail tape measure protein [Rhodopseudomonas palustris]|uniref:phage tail tape measure protein n=1 Tax=Rhodopseudomonas palustris TaxID=1076 RepID=UPI0006427371|nr:phage tail tape measure protein [Rhodopseudomonas palustris]